jgi:hypothetical protein
MPPPSPEERKASLRSAAVPESEALVDRGFAVGGGADGRRKVGKMIFPMAPSRF